MKFVHTADWQIGKVFKQFGAKEEILRRARLDAIDAIGRLAAKEGAKHVLVAGDVYDTEAPAAVTLLEPLERMKMHSQVTWHLLPGNHDPHRPLGVWDRVLAANPAANIRPHLAPEAVEIEPSVVLFPCPLTRKSDVRDLSAWMDDVETAPGVIRIGLAHGAVTGFGSEGEANNSIDPRRAAIARLDYLALGDWHRTMRVTPSTWYAGTPEPDRWGSQIQGKALVVDIPGAGSTPLVEEIIVGAYSWVSREEILTDGSELSDIDASVRAQPNLSKTVLKVKLLGTMTLHARSELEQRIMGLEAALFDLNVDQSELVIRPTLADLENIDFDGVLRTAAEQLLVQANDAGFSASDRHTAEEALVRLYLLVSRPEAA
jgi:DNA repair exonuclease SbcCD nuclease subunit